MFLYQCLPTLGEAPGRRPARCQPSCAGAENNGHRASHDLADFGDRVRLTGGLGVSSAEHNTFRYSFQGDLNSLDPYSLNETFTLSTLANVMEGLIKRDKDLRIVPGLAERWEVLEPTRWRFHLRRGVKFHDGSPFTADDVVFSYDRARRRLRLQAARRRRPRK